MPTHFNSKLVRIVAILGMAAACLRADFMVTGTTPSSGSLVQPFSTFTATFNGAVNASSVQDTDLDVNGVAATSFTVSGDQVIFDVSASSFPNGIDLPNVVTLQGVQDSSNVSMDPYAATIYTTNISPFVVSDSINGQVLSPGPATDVATFSQPMNTAFTTASSFDLHGTNLGTNYSAVSFSWDPTGTILTINYLALPVDDYSLTLLASGFPNTVGLDLSSDYTADFCVSNTSACPAIAPVPETSSLGLLATMACLGFGPKLLRRIGAARKLAA